VEPDARFYRRRASEELEAAQRAVTPAARDRRIQLARAFLNRLTPDEAETMLFEWGILDPVANARIKKPDRHQSSYA
jgi:hypothetical protein